MFRKLKIYLAKKWVSYLPITVTPTFKTTPLEIKILRAKTCIPAFANRSKFLYGERVSYIDEYKREIATMLIDELIPLIEFEIVEENDGYYDYQLDKSFANQTLYGTIRVVGVDKKCNT